MEGRGFIWSDVWYMDTVFITITIGSKLKSVDLSQIMDSLQIAKAIWTRQDLPSLKELIVCGMEENKEEECAISSK